MKNEEIVLNTQKIPVHVKHVLETLQNKGFLAYVVGGAVRDMIMMEVSPASAKATAGKHETQVITDWDVTTNAKPEEIQSIFEKTVYENSFGTVMVFMDKTHTLVLPLTRGEMTRPEGETEGVEVTHETNRLNTSSPKASAPTVEVTPFRKEGKYSDSRHPDEVVFAETIEEDLKRRDFTMNAIAVKLENDKGHLVDPYNGIKDIRDKTIICVGDPDDRFTEDGLRMLRAIRFAGQLNFAISHETLESIIKNKDILAKISKERIRDEFAKMIESPGATFCIDLMVKTGVIDYVLPELKEGIGCEQGGAHAFDVYNHLLHALQFAVDRDFPFHVKLSALLHDIGKPRSKRPGKFKPTFYGHEVIGAKMSQKILENLKFSRETIETVTKLVRYHMFFSDTETITLSAVRRVVANVASIPILETESGISHPIWYLMQVRDCDRAGMNKKEAPYRLRKFHAMIEEVLRNPIDVTTLKINGKIMIEELHMKPGRRMGWILHALLEECLESPEKNEIEYLKSRAVELDKLSDEELHVLGEKAKEAKEEAEQLEVEKLHKKHGV